MFEQALEGRDHLEAQFEALDALGMVLNRLVEFVNDSRESRLTPICVEDVSVIYQDSGLDYFLAKLYPADQDIELPGYCRSQARSSKFESDILAMLAGPF